MAAAAQPPRDIIERRFEQRLGRRFGLGRRVRREDRLEQLFMHLGRKVVQRVDQPIALDRAPGRRQTRFGLAVGEILQHRGAFVQHLARLEPQRWHIAIARDGIEIAAVVGLYEAAVFKYRHGRQL